MHGWAAPLRRAGGRDGETPTRRRWRRCRLRDARHQLMTRALVLGGAGFIGTAACKELMRRGVETIAAGRKDRPYGTFTSYVTVDRTDEEQLKRALEQSEPNVLSDSACYHPGEGQAEV